MTVDILLLKITYKKVFIAQRLTNIAFNSKCFIAWKEKLAHGTNSENIIIILKSLLNIKKLPQVFV